MAQENITVFNDFARRAKERIEERKKRRTKQFFVEAEGVTLTLRGLTEQEFSECNDFSEDSLTNDKYGIYMACQELQENAQALMDGGVIKHHYEICDMFSNADRHALMEEILRLSGLYEEASVKPLDEVAEAKNS